MGIRLRINGKDRLTTGVTINETATPITGGDSSGSVGTMSSTLAHHAKNFLDVGKEFTYTDTEMGTTVGVIRNISNKRSSAVDDYDMVTRIARTNIEIQVAPFHGTIQTAFTYYMSLAGINSDFIVEDSIKNRTVVIPGFYGNLWTHIKNFAAAYQLDLSQVNNVIYLRPLRLNIARANQDQDRTLAITSDDLAQNVEINYYNNEWKTNAQAYPSALDGDSISDWDVLSVDANQVVTRDFPLSSSLQSIQQPVCVDAATTIFGENFVPTRSCYAIVGSDGLPVRKAQWEGQGGDVRFEILENTTTLRVTLTGPSPLQKDLDRVTSFRLAYSDGDNVFAALFALGTGVFFDEQTLTVSTGIDRTQTSQETASLENNRVVSTLDQAWTIAKRALPQYSGRKIEMSGSVRTINKRNRTGTVSYASYADVVSGLFAGMTYAQAKSSQSGKSYSFVFDLANQKDIEDLGSQVYGNLGGARIYDAEIARWFRIKDGSISPASISYTAEDDELYEDFLDMLNTLYTGSKTYAGVKTAMGGLTYGEAFALGASQVSGVLNELSSK